MMFKPIQATMFVKVTTILLLLGTFPLLASQPVVLPQLLKPTAIDVDDDFIYITEQFTLHVYRGSDLQHLKVFGEKGEGPGQFQRFIDVTVLPDQLLINSGGKISFFKKDGTFIRELSTAAAGAVSKFFPFNGGFVAGGSLRLPEGLYHTIDFYDPKLNKQNQLYKVAIPQAPNGKIDLISRSLTYRTHGDQLLAADPGELAISVLDAKGTPLHTITAPYKRRPFTGEDEKTVRAVVKELYAQHYPRIKDRLVFPDRFPAIMDFFIDQDKLYIATWTFEAKGILFYIFPITAKDKTPVKKVLPFHFENALTPYPVTFHNGTMYQLVENDDEKWDLHRKTVIKIK